MLSSKSSHDRNPLRSPSFLQRFPILRSRSLENLEEEEKTQTNKKKKHPLRDATSRLSWKNRSWLWTPPTRMVSHPRQRSEDAPSGPKLVRPTPALTLFLLRLDAHMQAYCRHLSDPSLENAKKVAAILDSSIATASPSSPSSVPSSSPSQHTNSKAKTKSRLAGSPKSSESAMALEAEWETYVSPLLLLAGAEAIYGRMEHILTSMDLSVRYQRLDKDLTMVKRQLCDPFLGEAHARTGRVHQAALSLSQTLQTLQTFSTIRCQMMSIQKELFSSEEPSWMVVEQSFRDLLPETKDNDMITALTSELHAWMSLLETARHLEQCRFMETIMSAKKLKGYLNLSSPSTLHIWFRQATERILSIMELYFDRITTFATPLYGLDRPSLVNNTESDRLGIVHDYETLVLDFIRRHDNKGGQSMAVTIVVDAVRTGNVQVERGFVLDRDGGTNEEKNNHDDETQEWRAVYMRSTLHASTTSPTTARSPSAGNSGISSIVRRHVSKTSFLSGQNLMRTSSKRDVFDDPGKSSSDVRRRAQSVDGGATSTPSQVFVDMNVMEYTNEMGASSWPYTEWKQLVQFLLGADGPSSPCSMFREESKSLSGHAVTYRLGESKPLPSPNVGETDMSAQQLLGTVEVPPAVVASSWVGSLSVGPHIPLPVVTSPPLPSPPSSPKRKKVPSVFHTIRLSEFLWMVVLVKGEEEGKWNLRRSRGHSDDEIRSFMDDMASKLRLSSLLQMEGVVTARKTAKPLDNPTGTDVATVWTGSKHLNEANTQEFLRSLKLSFGLRQSPMIESPYRNGKGKPNFRNYRRARKRRLVNFDESALSFFLGDELVQRLQRA